MEHYIYVGLKLLNIIYNLYYNLYYKVDIVIVINIINHRYFHHVGVAED